MDPIARTGLVTAEVAQAVLGAATSKAAELGVRVWTAVVFDDISCATAGAAAFA